MKRFHGPLTGSFLCGVLHHNIMDTSYRVINANQLDMLLKLLKRSIHYCENASSIDLSDPYQEPTQTYSGASGYARATMQMVVDDLSALPER